MIAVLKSSFAQAWNSGQMQFPMRKPKNKAETPCDPMAERRAEMQSLFQDDLDQLTRRARRSAQALPEHS